MEALLHEAHAPPVLLHIENLQQGGKQCSAVQGMAGTAAPHALLLAEPFQGAILLDGRNLAAPAAVFALQGLPGARDAGQAA
jgi:hypothetical protein